MLYNGGEDRAPEGCVLVGDSPDHQALGRPAPAGVIPSATRPDRRWTLFVQADSWPTVLPKASS